MEYIIISHKSAFRYWGGEKAHRHPDECRFNFALWDNIATKLPREQGQLLDSLRSSKGELDLLVNDTSQRCHPDGRVVHYWKGGFLPGSMCKVSDGVLVASPEMLYVQLAQSLSIQAVIACATVLCSSYFPVCKSARCEKLDAVLSGSASTASLKGDERRGFYRRLPLTSKARLYDFLSALKNHNGVAKARRALRWASEGAASAREAELAIRLFSARCYGGDGLPAAMLNLPVYLDDAAKMMSGKLYCIADFVWPEKRLILEYDSNQHHSDKSAMQKDSRRRNALLHMGFDVMSYTNDIFTDQQARTAAVKQLESRLYPYGRKNARTFEGAAEELYRAARELPRCVI